MIPLIFSLSALNDLHLLAVFDDADFSISSHDLVLSRPFVAIHDKHQWIIERHCTVHTTHHAGRSSLTGDCCSGVERSSVVCWFCAVAAAVPPRPQDGTACFSHRTLHHSVQLRDRL